MVLIKYLKKYFNFYYIYIYIYMPSVFVNAEFAKIIDYSPDIVKRVSKADATRADSSIERLPLRRLKGDAKNAGQIQAILACLAQLGIQLRNVTDTDTELNAFAENGDEVLSNLDNMNVLDVKDGNTVAQSGLKGLRNLITSLERLGLIELVLKYHRHSMKQVGGRKSSRKHSKKSSKRSSKKSYTR